MQIAVVGGGIAGTTAAFLLAEAGHDVTLFEQAPKCGPVGAGILLQPAGQAVLAELGLLGQVEVNASRIEALHAQHRTGRELVHLDYAKLANETFGLGVHRGELFELLLDRARRAGVQIREGIRIERYKQTSNHVELIASDGPLEPHFEIVVASDGSRSLLRTHSKLIRRCTEYPYAALWMVGPWSGDNSRLLQVLDPTGRLVGILPIGHGRASFFWGLWTHEWDKLRSQPAEHWQRSATAFLPECEQIIAGVTSMDDVTFATYRNVRLRKFYDGRVILLGDAAHAMSPHLGQGTNLALADALCLARAIGHTNHWQSAFLQYANERHQLISYYGRLTGLLTPFFQTDNRFLQFGRNLVLPTMPRLPFIGREMLRTLSGVKRGWLR